jgi:hypothetical protein
MTARIARIRMHAPFRRSHGNKRAKPRRATLRPGRLPRSITTSLSRHKVATGTADSTICRTIDGDERRRHDPRSRLRGTGDTAITVADLVTRLGAARRGEEYSSR